MNPQKEISIFYMCEPGRLEWQSLCLASSILALCTDSYQLIAYCSRHKMSGLRESTISFHKRHNIPIVPLNTEGVFDNTYHVGGKIIAADQSRASSFGVLMDTDTMLVSNTSFRDLSRPGAICAFASDTNALRFSASDWRLIYNKLGFDLPKERVRFDYPGGKIVLDFPYFNAGLIIFPEHLPTKSFGAAWLESTKALQKDERVLSQRQWLDQISLPVAIKMLGLLMQPVDRIYNFPVEEEGRQIRADVKIIHYHFGVNLQTCSSATVAETLLLELTEFKSLDQMFKSYDLIGHTGRN